MNNSHPQEIPLASSGLSVRAGSAVWLKMDFRASLTNMLLTLPVVVIVGIAAHETGRMHFMAGTMAGLWLGSAHNVLWGWLVRNQASQNAGDVARPGNNLKSKE